LDGDYSHQVVLGRFCLPFLYSLLGWPMHFVLYSQSTNYPIRQPALNFARLYYSLFSKNYVSFHSIHLQNWYLVPESILNVQIGFEQPKVVSFIVRVEARQSPFENPEECKVPNTGVEVRRLALRMASSC